MIKDRLNIQGNTNKLLREGYKLFLETEKGMKLEVECVNTRELAKEKKEC